MYKILLTSNNFPLSSVFVSCKRHHSIIRYHCKSILENKLINENNVPHLLYGLRVSNSLKNDGCNERLYQRRSLSSEKSPNSQQPEQSQQQQQPQSQSHHEQQHIWSRAGSIAQVNILY